MPDAGTNSFPATGRWPVPAGRCLGPDDVLPGLCFLLSAEAAAINGSVVTLDGGLGALKLPEL